MHKSDIRLFDKLACVIRTDQPQDNIFKIKVMDHDITKYLAILCQVLERKACY